VNEQATALSRTTQAMRSLAAWKDGAAALLAEATLAGGGLSDMYNQSACHAKKLATDATNSATAAAKELDGECMGLKDAVVAFMLAVNVGRTLINQPRAVCRDRAACRPGAATRWLSWRQPQPRMLGLARQRRIHDLCVPRASTPTPLLLQGARRRWKCARPAARLHWRRLTVQRQCWLPC
jgi:hypothetical protein